MAKEISTRIHIQASPAKVWAILTNFQDYPRWNPFITAITGTLALGHRIKVRIQPPNAKSMTFTPRVRSFTPQHEWKWLGHLFIPGLFDGEHRFELIDHQDGTTTLIHSERFKGILVPLLLKLMGDNTRQGFIAMNEKLKAEAEA